MYRHRLHQSALLFTPLFLPALLPAQTVEVDITPGHSVNAFSPRLSLGAGVDGVGEGVVDKVYTPANIQQMLSAGFGPLTYRLYTELSVQDWHWNPSGTFSRPGNKGYWTSSSVPVKGQGIAHSHGYNLPRSGFTFDQGSNSNYSRLDDGDPTTFWKSNPYLANAYTADGETSHPQWILVDLGSLQPVNAIRLNWAQPFATAFQVQYWTGDDPFYDQANGQWITFPTGGVASAKGGQQTLQLAASPISVEFIRVWMTASSGTCAAATAPGDPRDCLGYAVNEVGIGTIANGAFTDLMTHAPNQSQTATYASSVDPWHTASDEETGEEQPGLDLIFTSGITRGIPPILPVTMLYGTPENAANEIAYLEKQGYQIGYVEMGEEPDGQFILPEDYAALYIQWARALHAVDPKLRLGGPVLEADLEVTVWADQNGNTSWLNRFLNYLNEHGASSELAFMSYEHYPYNPCTFDWNGLLQEPTYTRASLRTWANDGLPADVPVFVTESNASWDFQQQQVGLFGALWFADFTGVFLSAGGKQVYFYEYEPLPLYPASECNSWGSYSMFLATDNSQVLGYTSQYFSAQMLTQRWTEPINATHYVYPSTSDIRASNGAALVTAYTVLRPDGQWSLLLINKDENQPHAVQVNFQNGTATQHLQGPVTQVNFGLQQYVWHPDNAQGFPWPDGPLVSSVVMGTSGTEYTLPAASITVLRGNIQ